MSKAANSRLSPREIGFQDAYLFGYDKPRNNDPDYLVGFARGLAAYESVLACEEACHETR